MSKRESEMKVIRNALEHLELCAKPKMQHFLNDKFLFQTLSPGLPGDNSGLNSGNGTIPYAVW